MKLTPAEIIQDAVATHNVDEIWGMFSGGHDSLVSSHIASLAPQFKGILHIDTGTGIPDTQQYVIDTCNRYSWHLKIYRAVENTRADGTPDPMIYRDLVLRWGFPGANLHQFMYSRLKERQIHRFVRDRKTSGVKRIGLVTGARIAESDRRKRNFKQGMEVHRREGSRVWIAPTLLFSDDDCQSYMKSYNLPRNPVKDNLCMSAECLCGAYSQPNELTQIEFFYPEVAARIKALEAEVKAQGFPWGWEDQPPKW
jgi:3'-phosphoadenosine 5'-phosphosulfate sulfotransferase (PAPS reductase)/FAD synthetase